MSKAIDAHLLREFKVGELMGSGAYGHVWRVQARDGRKWALKKVFGAFRNRTDAQRTYREVQVLRQLKHQNIVRLERVIAARNEEDLYLLFELMEADLLAVVGYLSCDPAAAFSRSTTRSTSCTSSSPLCSTCTASSSSTATSSPATSSSTPTAASSSATSGSSAA